VSDSGKIKLATLPTGVMHADLARISMKRFGRPS
jgi:hypothetical protein